MSTSINDVSLTKAQRAGAAVAGMLWHCIDRTEEMQACVCRRDMQRRRQ